MFDWEKLARERDEKNKKAWDADSEAFRANIIAGEAKREAEKAKSEVEFARWADGYLRGLYEEWKKAQATQAESAKESP